MQIVNHLEIRDGTAYIVGRNVKAKMVARMYIWEHAAIEDIMEQYNLAPAEVHSAITYYYDNQDALDSEYEQNIATLNHSGTSFNDFKQKIGARRQNNAL